MGSHGIYGVWLLVRCTLFIILNILHTVYHNSYIHIVCVLDMYTYMYVIYICMVCMLYMIHIQYDKNKTWIVIEYMWSEAPVQTCLRYQMKHVICAYTETESTCICLKCTTHLRGIVYTVYVICA